MMAAVAARELADGEVVFVGIGLPNLACNLARRTHAPNLVLIYESGAVGATPSRLPVSIGDPALVTGSLMETGRRDGGRSEEHTSELQSQSNLVCRLLLDKKNRIDKKAYREMISTQPS